MTKGKPPRPDDNVLSFPAEHLNSLKKGGGGGTFDGMEARIAHLEGRFDGLEKRFDGLDTKLDRIENKIPSEWAMAKVVFFVVGALMAAAIWGPRALTLLQSTTP